MGWFDRLRFVRDVASDPAPQFAVDWDSVDSRIYGYGLNTSYIPPEGRISRREAIQVPAVKGVRDLICNALGSLPIDILGADNKASTSWTTLLEQPERNCAREITMAWTFDDLLFEAVAWWRIVEFGWHGYPIWVKRVPAREVTVDPEGRAWIGGKHVPDRELIRFDSPTDALLDAGARAIRTSLKLIAAAGRYADETQATGYFEPREGADPMDDVDVVELLDNWKLARQTRTTAYVPAALKYNVTEMSAAELQLDELIQSAGVWIVETVGLSPEDIGLSTTSRTYLNGQAKRLEQINDVYGPYASAVSGRLSLGDVTPRGYRVEFDFNGYLKADDKTRFEVYQIGVDMGLYTLEYVAQREGLPKPPGKPEAPAQPLPIPKEITA